MRKSHTTFSRLTADTFNLHKMFGDGVIAVGQFSVVGTDIIVPSYTVQYNGIIVEETTPQTVAFVAADNYVCVHGIDASETSTPTIEALPAPLGVILLERAGASGWRSAKPLTITNGRRQQSFRRIADGSDLYLSYGAGYGEDDTRGTVRNIAIDSLDQLPFDDMTVGESLAAAGSTPWAVGVMGWASCKNAFMYTDGVDTFIQYEPDIVGIMPLQILAVVPAVMSVCALSPTRFAYAYYDAAVPNVVIVNSWTAGNPAPDGIDISITLPFDPIDANILSGTEIVAQDATGIIIQATFNSVGTLSNIRNGVTRDTYFVNNGHLSFTDTLGDVYLDWLYVKPAYGAFSYAMNNGEEIIEMDVIGANHVAIQNGCVTKVIPTSMFGAGRFLAGDKIVIATSGMMGGISARFYDTKTYSTSIGFSIPGMFLIDLIETDNYFVYYNGTKRFSMNHSPTSVGSLVEQNVDIQGRALCRYGKKELHLRSDVDYLYMYSNTHLKTSNYVNNMAFVGTYAAGVSITPVSSTYYTIVDRETYDGDHFLFMGGMTRGYACETPDGVPYGVVPGVVADIVADQFSGDMYVDGGWYIGMTVNATDTVISNARIMNLTIEHVRNVNFIGCDILAYTDIVDPANNTYKFIGCTIAGVPANTFLALTDTPMAYTPATDEGRLVVVNTTPDGLEFTAAARINPATGIFEYDRVDYVDNVEQVAYDSPSPMEIHTHTGDPTGFENLTDSTISYDPLTQTLTLTPVVSFAFWRNGIRYEYTAPVVFPAHPTTDGTHFFYFDDADPPAPTTSTSFWDLSKYVPVSYVQYNSALADGYASEERHGLCMDWATHKHLHFTVGAYAQSGFGLGDVLSPAIPWVTNASNKITVDFGVVADEDLENNNNGHLAADAYTFMYRSGATGIWTWVRSSLGGTTYPYQISGGWITYNDGTWGLSAATHNMFVNSFVFATNSLDGDFEIVVVPGQALHTSLSAAKEETVVSLAFGDKPFQEWVPLYRLTYQAQNGWDPAAGRARIVDFVRLTGTNSLALSASVSYHGALGGLSAPNSHPATAISYDNTTSELVDVDVQSNLDELSSGFAKIIRDATFTAPAVFDAIEIMPKFLPTGDCVFSCDIDVLVTVISDTVATGPTTPGTMAHRRIMATVHVESGVPDTYTILAQDTDIYYEDAEFTVVRGSPLVHLGAGTTDCIELYTSAGEFGVIVRGIKYVVTGPAGDTTASVTRYSVTFNLNSVDYV